MAFVKIGDHIKGAVMQKVVLALILYGIWTIVGEVEDIFKSKNAYNPNFFPPAHYKKGSLRFDQGHTV